MTKEIQSKIKIPEYNVKDIPSGFKPYPLGTRISYRLYTYSEVAYEAESKVDLTSTFNSVLRGIKTTRMDAGDLTLMDFYFIALLRKISSFGDSKYEVTFEVDGEIRKSTLSSSEHLVFDELETKLPAKTNINNTDMVFSPMTVKNWIKLLEMEKENDFSAVLAVQCTNLEYDEAYNLIANSSGADLNKLSLISEAFDHGVKPVDLEYYITEPNPAFDDSREPSLTNTETIAVRKEETVNIGDVDTLILPFRGSNKSAGDDVSFGVS